MKERKKTRVLWGIFHISLITLFVFGLLLINYPDKYIPVSIALVLNGTFSIVLAAALMAKTIKEWYNH